jgi:SAM-dependent methyltransferase
MGLARRISQRMMLDTPGGTAMTDLNDANEAQREHWNTVAGPKWTTFSERLDQHLTHVGRLLLESAMPLYGEAVLEIGCGTGGMLAALAAAVGDAGRVTGIDIAAAMLEAARESVRRHSLGNVTLIEGDAQTHAFDPGSADLLVSRFGVMFFADPVMAFGNLRRATRRGGRLCFVCWAPLKENPHWSLALAAAARRLGPPEQKPPHAPGPFAFSDVNHVEHILRSAGFVDIGISRQTPDLVGDSPEDEAEFLCTMGPAATLIAERGATPGMAAAIKEEIGSSLQQFVRDGQLLIPASIYVVQARQAG